MSSLATKAIFSIAGLVLALTIGTSSALADHEGDDDSGRHGAVSSVVVEANKAYSAECSTCHVLYAPWLLPARSWDKLLKGSRDHFGDDLALSEAQISELGKYLSAGSADKVSYKLAKKIAQSATGETPLRITEVPYIKREHRKLDATVFKRKSIGSFSNCGACHPGADKWDFDEDAVSVPRQ